METLHSLRLLFLGLLIAGLAVLALAARRN
jgi:hypothetical protein